MEKPGESHHAGRKKGPASGEIKAIKRTGGLQQPIKQAGLPVLLIFEGLECVREGGIISK